MTVFDLESHLHRPSTRALYEEATYVVLDPIREYGNWMRQVYIEDAEATGIFGITLGFSDRPPIRKFWEFFEFEQAINALQVVRDHRPDLRIFLNFLDEFEDDYEIEGGDMLRGVIHAMAQFRAFREGDEWTMLLERADLGCCSGSGRVHSPFFAAIATRLG